MEKYSEFSICPDCGKLFYVERVNNGVGWCYHGICCGWGRDQEPLTIEEYDKYIRKGLKK